MNLFCLMQKGNQLHQGWTGQEQRAEELGQRQLLCKHQIMHHGKLVQPCVKKPLWESYGKFLLRVCNYITTCLKATTKFSRVSRRTELNGILGHVCSKTFYYRMGTMIKEKPNSKSWQQHTPRECWKHTSKNKLQWVRHLVIERIASRAASEWELLEWNRRGRSVLSINSIDCCIQSLAQ